MTTASALDWFRVAPGWLCVVGPDNRIIDVSNDLLNSLGYERDELTGCDFLEIAKPQVRAIPAVAAIGNTSLARVEQDARVTLLTRRNAGLPARLQERHIAPGNDDGSGFVVIHLEDLRRHDALHHELEDQSRLNVQTRTNLSEFTHLAAHDLHEPLRKIEQFAKLLEENFPDSLDDDAAFYVRSMVRAAGRLGTLVNRLMEYSRARNEVFEEESRPLIETLREAFDRHFPDAIDLVGESLSAADSDEATVLLDPFWTDRLLASLIENAVLYRQPERPFRFNISVSRSGRDGAGRRIELSDNGIGFDPEHAERVFEPFRRLHTRQTHPGVGMGLAIARAICERMGWHIGATSTPDEGATFVIEIPEARMTSR